MTRSLSRGLAAARRAFTLIELLVVVALFVVLLAIGVPAFRALLESSDESLAENALRGGVAAARDAAARGGQGQDAAAVFFYDSFAHKISVVPCVFVGTFLDTTNVPVLPGSSNDVLRDVFVPMPGYEPSQLPRGWMVRGYAVPSSIDNQWYGDSTAYAPVAVRQQGNWLFPETDFYNWNVANSGANRQTVMIRFEGGTGALKAADGQAVLVISPAPSDNFRAGAPYSDTRYRLDTSVNQLRTVRQIMDAPFAGGLNIAQRRQLIGDLATDSVLAKPVRLISMSSDAKGLAPYMSVRIDRATGSIYQDANSPQFVPGVTVSAINEYMNGADTAGAIETRARIFSVHRYLGTLQEITGTRDGQGVGQ